MKERFRRTAILVALGILTVAGVRTGLLEAFVKNETTVLVMIGLYPVALFYWIHTRRLRFGLAELSTGCFGFGAALVPLHYLLERSGYSLREYPIIVLYVEIMIVIGFAAALKDRELLHEQFVLLRWIIFIATLLAPAMALPALIMTVALVMSGSPFRNDTVSGIAYLALVAPPMVAFWFWGIKEARKGDKAPE